MNMTTGLAVATEIRITSRHLRSRGKPVRVFGLWFTPTPETPDAKGHDKKTPKQFVRNLTSCHPLGADDAELGQAVAAEPRQRQRGRGDGSLFSCLVRGHG